MIPKLLLKPLEPNLKELPLTTKSLVINFIKIRLMPETLTRLEPPLLPPKLTSQTHNQLTKQTLTPLLRSRAPQPKLPQPKPPQLLPQLQLVSHQSSWVQCPNKVLPKHPLFPATISKWTTSTSESEESEKSKTSTLKI